MYITPDTARSKLSPKLNYLIDSLNIRWVEADMAHKVIGRTLPSTTQGAYSQAQDAIIIRKQDYGFRTVNYVFLHELGHWTGSVMRLSREALVTIAQDIYPTEQQKDQEEAIAEIVARKLSIYFDLLSVHDAFAVSMCYLVQYPYADLPQAELDAETAVQYILKEAGLLKDAA